MTMNLDELIALATSIEGQRIDLAGIDETIRTYFRKRRQIKQQIADLEQELRDVVAKAATKSQPPVEEQTVFRRSDCGPGARALIEGRYSRPRTFEGWSDCVECLSDRSTEGQREHIYRGSEYIRCAAVLGVGTHDTESRVVFLTQEEIPLVRDRVYRDRVRRGNYAGIPDAWLANFTLSKDEESSK
jgi:hypothetical protein